MKRRDFFKTLALGTAGVTALRTSPAAAFSVLSVTIFWTFSREFSSFYCNPQGKAIIIGSWLPQRDFNASLTLDFVNSI